MLWNPQQLVRVDFESGALGSNIHHCSGLDTDIEDLLNPEADRIFGRVLSKRNANEANRET